MELSAQIFAFAKDPELRRLGDAANQLERAGLSISNNIAEGFERGTTLNRMSALTHLQSEI